MIIIKTPIGFYIASHKKDAEVHVANYRFLFLIYSNPTEEVAQDQFTALHENISSNKGVILQNRNNNLWGMQFGGDAGQHGKHEPF